MFSILLDENFNGNVTRGLIRRRPNIDLIDAREVGLGGEEDPVVLGWAARDGRVLVTHDVNTMPGFAYERIAAGLPMPGVIIVPDQMPIGPAIEDPC